MTNLQQEHINLAEDHATLNKKYTDDIAEKDSLLADKDRQLTEKDQAYAKLNAEHLALKNKPPNPDAVLRQLASLKKENEERRKIGRLNHNR